MPRRRSVDSAARLLNAFRADDALRIAFQLEMRARKTFKAIGNLAPGLAGLKENPPT